MKQYKIKKYPNGYAIMKRMCLFFWEPYVSRIRTLEGAEKLLKSIYEEGA